MNENDTNAQLEAAVGQAHKETLDKMVAMMGDLSEELKLTLDEYRKLLHPDIRPYVERGGRLSGPFTIWHGLAHHPLGVMAPAHEINAAYLAKKQWVDESLASGRYNSALIMYSSPFRLEVLSDWTRRFHLHAPENLHIYRECLATAWQHTEHPHQYPKEDILRLFKYAGWFTDHDDDDWLNPPPRPKQRLTLYRGGTDPRAKRGLSWTADPEKAEWFARRWLGFRSKGYVWQVTPPPSHLLACFVGRGEAEYVIDTSRLRISLVAEYETHPDARADSAIPDIINRLETRRDS